jgi:hypothetical protein
METGVGRIENVLTERKEMVGTRRLELLTSTVSNLKPVRDDARPKKPE